MSSKSRANTAPVQGESTALTDEDELSTPAVVDDDAEVNEPKRVGRLLAPKIIRSRGQELLIALPGSLQQIGESIGATKQAVSLWRDGSRVPTEKWRRKLSALYGIPVDAWGLRPGSAFDRPSAALMPAGSPSSSTSEGEPSVMADCLALLAALRVEMQRTDMLAREKLQVTESFSKALALKHRLMKEGEQLEDRTIRKHPKWKRLRELIIGALLDFPEAARAVEAVIIEALGAEEEDGPE